MGHYRDNPSEVGDARWRKFIREIVQPLHKENMARATPEQQADAERILAVFGGHLVRAE
jgi:hypothetical protein